jgi:sulfite dehydrogenase
MNSRSPLRSAAFSLVALLAILVLAVNFATLASALEIKLPPETAAYAPSNLPGYAAVTAHCFTCHSAEYARYQPPASTRAYWKATVVKMQKVFGAPLPESEIDPIVDYLVKTYGAERTEKVAPKP